MNHPAATGIAFMVAAVGCFALMDAALKELVLRHAPMQVTFLRGAASLPLVLLLVSFTGGWRMLRPVRWGLQLARGVLSVAMLWLFVYAVQTLSLADAYSIYLSAPLFITALSVPLLGEKVGWKHWTAICVGMAGVLVMLRPTASAFVTIGGLAALGTAVLYALNAIAIGILARTETTSSMVFWTLVVVTVLAGLTCFDCWTPISRADWLSIVALGITGTAGQHCITEAFRRAPASIIAPFEYTALLWAVALDWALWGVLPNSRMLVGAALVVASGLYLIVRARTARVMSDG